ncbi:MAG TPA: hypothetical protein VKP69_26035, partial [Isosphaeraceae bacterium]|nr:hypothetical protein [Isosphaeraceae bacterium]
GPHDANKSGTLHQDNTWLQGRYKSFAVELSFSTTRQTARNAGDYEDAASDFLEKTYADRSGASSGLSTTYGILSFVGFLAVCRTVVL